MAKAASEIDEETCPNHHPNLDNEISHKSDKSEDKVKKKERTVLRRTIQLNRTVHHSQRQSDDCESVMLLQSVPPDVDSSLSTDENGTKGCNEKGQKRLRLMMLACEDNPPYGPERSTASLFMDLICHSAQISASSPPSLPNKNSDNDNKEQNQYLTVSITIYHVKQMDFPTTPSEWDSYDGILLPGSFSSAYDTKTNPWIYHLQNIIVTEIHAKQRKTLAVCFGHQSFAHAFRDSDIEDTTAAPQTSGCTITCPAGPQIGHRAFYPTPEGIALLFPSSSDSSSSSTEESEKEEKKKEKVELLYTHEDMVFSLPSCAVSLGGNEAVPIEAAAYFPSDKDASSFKDSVGKNLEPTTLPYAITFQAHPEYTSTNGFHGTFTGIVKISKEQSHMQQIVQGAYTNMDCVMQDSVGATVAVGRILGWF